MVEHIQKLAATIQLSQENIVSPGVHKIHGNPVPDLGGLLIAFAEELGGLDARDFEPSVRHDFVVLRVAMRNWAKGNIGDGSRAAADAMTVANLLDSYAGEGTGAVTRDLSFIKNPDVKKLVERDYRELTLRAFPDGSWKSTVILAGSILEAVLYDVLTKDAAAIAATNAATKAPPKKGGGKRDITKTDYDNQWTLSDMIKVACELKLLPLKDEGAVHQVLREYRNFVHPRLELQSGFLITEGYATASMSMLDVILDHLTP